MKQIDRLASIPVNVPCPNDIGSTYGVPMLTALFRADCHVPKAYGLAKERVGQGELSLAVLACSVGTGVDSVLSLDRLAGRAGGVRARGYDANRLAVETARLGQYTVLERDIEERYAMQATLKDLGFATSFEGGGDGSDPYSRLQVDATPVRDGYDVRFIEHNLFEPIPADEGADLVTVDNVLGYIRRDFGFRGTSQVVRNAASLLSDRGVISFGGNTFHEPPRWIEQTVTLLDGEFGLQPVFTERSFSTGEQVPVMFART